VDRKGKLRSLKKAKKEVSLPEGKQNFLAGRLKPGEPSVRESGTRRAKASLGQRGRGEGGARCGRLGGG